MAAISAAMDRTLYAELARDVEAGQARSGDVSSVEDLTAEVENACKRAASVYGLTGRRALRLYIQVCIEFGWRFDSQHGWVAPALGDRTLGDPAARVRWVLDELHRRARVKAENRRRLEAFLA